MGSTCSGTCNKSRWSWKAVPQPWLARTQLDSNKVEVKHSYVRVRLCYVIIAGGLDSRWSADQSIVLSTVPFHNPVQRLGAPLCYKLCIVNCISTSLRWFFNCIQEKLAFMNRNTPRVHVLVPPWLLICSHVIHISRLRRGYYIRAKAVDHVLTTFLSRLSSTSGTIQVNIDTVCPNSGIYLAAKPCLFFIFAWRL